MCLELSELFLQDLQPLLLVGDVRRGRGKLLGLQQLLQFGQLRLLLPVGNVETLLDIHLVALVLLLVGKRGVVQADDLVYPPECEELVSMALQ